MFEVVPLGVGSALPTRERHLSATAVVREGIIYLFDCGEGTQFQLIHAGLKRSRIRALFITHLHGDHFYGLMGLLSTLSMLKRTGDLTLVGPSGIKRCVQVMQELSAITWNFTLHFVELQEGFDRRVVYEESGFYVEARPLKHRIFTVGYRFQEKPRAGKFNIERARALGIDTPEHIQALIGGRSIRTADGQWVAPEGIIGPERPGGAFAYCTDTRPCENSIWLAREADLLYHEATFTEAMKDRAVETGHSTAKEAAEVALQANVRKLLIGHFSARYREVTPLVEEARRVFPCTEAAEELKRYVVKPTQETEKTSC